MTLRPLVVTPTWDPEGGYGGQESVRVLRDGLADLGLDVWVAAGEVVSGGGDRVREVGSSLGLARLAREVDADVLHLYNVEDVARLVTASALSRVPSLATVNSYWPTCLFGDMHFPSGELCQGCSVAGIRRDLEERPPSQVGREVPAALGRAEVARRTWLLRRVDALTTQSRACRDQLARGGVPAEDVRVVPNVASRSLLEAPEPDGDRDEPVVLFVGQLKAAKGPGLLLEAFRAVREAVPEARLQVAGDGPEAEALRAQAGDLGLGDAVSFLGYVERDELVERYRRAQVLALPTLWHDPFPRVVLEAWAHGAPVVTTTRGGPGEVVDDGRTGRIVPPYDPDAMAGAIVDLLEDGEARQALREAGRAELHRYAPAEVLPGYVDVYRELGSG